MLFKTDTVQTSIVVGVALSEETRQQLNYSATVLKCNNLKLKASVN